MDTENKYIPEPVFFDFDTFKQTLQPERYEKNTFIQNLFYRVQFPFEVDQVIKVIQLYRLGTVATGYRAGAITFPFIDIKGNIRAVQVKQFDETNHTTGTGFLHSMIKEYHTRNNKPLPEWLETYIKQDKPFSCLFGEHLLNKYHSNPVALVEDPITAVYGTLYFGLPETPKNLIWLAVYNKSGFSFDKLKVLQGRFVYVFPDLSKDGNTLKDRETEAEEYESRLPGTRFIVSDLAPERDKSGAHNLADFLIKQDWRLFNKRNIEEQLPQPEPEKVTKITNLQNVIFSHVEESETEQIEHPIKLNSYSTITDCSLMVKSHFTAVKEKPRNWDNDISELENYFESIEIPTHPVKLNSYSTITDCSLMVKSHFTAVKANNGNSTFLPFLMRLRELKQVLTTNSN